MLVLQTIIFSIAVVHLLSWKQTDLNLLPLVDISQTFENFIYKFIYFSWHRKKNFEMYEWMNEWMNEWQNKLHSKITTWGFEAQNERLRVLSLPETHNFHRLYGSLLWLCSWTLLLSYGAHFTSHKIPVDR